MKQMGIALVAGLVLATAYLPDRSEAATFLPQQAGDSFGFSAYGSSDASIFYVAGQYRFSLAAPAKLVDLTVQDEAGTYGLPFNSFDVLVKPCDVLVSCTATYSANNVKDITFTAPDLPLDPGNYSIVVTGTYINLSSGYASDALTISGRFVAATPIPPALLMFGTALAGLGGLAFRRRRLAA